MFHSTEQQVVRISTEPLVFFRGLSPEDVKNRLVQGTLLTSLQNRFMKVDTEYCLTGIQIIEKEIYRKGSSFLILRLEFQRSTGGKAIVREMVLQLPFSSTGKTLFWYYPEDPDLPTLTKMYPCQTFLQKAAWERPWKNIFCSEDEIFVQRLLYNPRLRATFLLSSPKASKKLILKIIKSCDFKECLGKIEVIRRCNLNKRIAFPSLISYSVQEKAFLYNYIPGLRIDKLNPLRLKKIKPLLFEEIVLLLSEIHKTRPPLLPQWNPMDDINRMSSSLDYLEKRHPGESVAIRHIFENLCECFLQKVRAYDNMIHNDFSAKHILYDDDEKFDSFISERLALIDWDNAVLGPKEKDIGEFMSGSMFTEKEDYSIFLNLYQKRTGHAIDVDLVNGFIQYHSFLKVCRRILRNSAASKVHYDLIRKSRYQIEHNPLKG